MATPLLLPAPAEQWTPKASPPETQWVAVMEGKKPLVQQQQVGREEEAGGTEKESTAAASAPETTLASGLGRMAERKRVTPGSSLQERASPWSIASRYGG